MKTQKEKSILNKIEIYTNFKIKRFRISKNLIKKLSYKKQTKSNKYYINMKNQVLKVTNYLNEIIYETYLLFIPRTKSNKLNLIPIH